jgi:hypothetical protein
MLVPGCSDQDDVNIEMREVKNAESQWPAIMGADYKTLRGLGKPFGFKEVRNRRQDALQCPEFPDALTFVSVFSPDVHFTEAHS